jgi:hypothetical protein
MPKMIVDWNTIEGKKRLQSARYSKHFYALAHLFERQQNPTYCGIASAVMVLNALRLNKKGLKLESKMDVISPDGEMHIRYNTYTQQTFLTKDSERIKKRKVIEGKDVCAEDGFDPGLKIDALAKNLKLHLCNVTLVCANNDLEKSLKRFRQDLMGYLNDSKTYIIANFDSAKIGREGAGHYSPMVAYDEATDSCLVMDTAGHKQPWFWVDAPLFFDAMNTKDGKQQRGYLIVSDALDR